MITLSNSQKSNLGSVLSSLPAGSPHVALNPATGAHQKLIENFLDLANQRSDRFPALHAALATQAKGGQAPANAQPSEGASLVDLGADRSGRATARSWISPTAGSVLTSASTLVVDAASNEPLAFGTHTTVGAGLATAATATATAKPASGQLRAVTLYHTLPAPGQPARFGLVSGIASPALGAGATGGTLPVNLSAPVISHTGNTGILIALNRPGGGPQEADYTYTADNNISPLNLMLPFIGNLQLPNTITGFDPNTGLFTSTGGFGVTAQIYAAVTPGGSSYKSIAGLVNPAGVFGNVGVGTPVPANPTTVYWNWPYQPTVVQGSNGGLQFTPDDDANSGLTAPWTNSAFFFQFRVPIVTGVGPGTYTFTICSTDTPEEPSSQCYQIPDLQFWWHCLAAGTLVTLEGGAKVPIEKITNGMRVLTGFGTASVGVEATIASVHRKAPAGRADESIYKLTTKGGRSLILTAEHAVRTPRGLAIPARLQKGDLILAITGPDTVESCAPVAHAGEFYNLKLVNAQDRRAGVLPDAATFVANDLVVGDVPALLQHHRATTHNLEFMQGRLPQALHRDYASALADIARQP